jgi:hypothetical protein
MTLAREGELAGATQCALVKSTPSETSLSKLGVSTPSRQPIPPTQSFMSSMAINSTLGLSPESFGFSWQPEKKPTPTHKENNVLFILRLLLNKMRYVPHHFALANALQFAMPCKRLAMNQPWQAIKNRRIVIW